MFFLVCSYELQAYKALASRLINDNIEIFDGRNQTGQL